MLKLSYEIIAVDSTWGKHGLLHGGKRWRFKN
jgi:hypothetical protein